jgi:membrane associated rhomboid family serine protease
MLPLRDNIPSRSFPVITIFIIVLNIAAFFYELSLGESLEPFFYQFGIVPARVFSGTEAQLAIPGLAIPFLTSMFLHGGILHLVGNMWYLWIFGDNVEDRLGHFKFLFFYLLCGLGASIVHMVFNPKSAVPSIGASGAIAGVLGAYLISYPFARVLTLVPLFIIWEFIEIPAMIVLGVWFLLQFLSGTASLTSASAQAGGIAWWAHIGGFLIGIVLLFILRPKSRQQSYAVRYY